MCCTKLLDYIQKMRKIKMCEQGVNTQYFLNYQIKTDMFFVTYSSQILKTDKNLKCEFLDDSPFDFYHH